MIKGETVILIEKTQTGTDPFNKPIYSEVETPVNDVLVGTPTFESKTSEYNLTGKRIAFILGIPKKDTHDWKDANVKIRGQLFKTYGFPLTQTDANVPGKWNTQVKVECYE